MADQTLIKKRHMQTYFFYQHAAEHYTYVSKVALPDQTPEFVWLDCTRSDVIHQAETWHKAVQQQTGILLNEYHIRDILF